MLKRERIQLILSLVEKQGTISVTELEALLDVSAITIRRDINELSQKKLLKRTHGGAISNSNQKHQHLNYSERKEIHLAEKMKIAKEAASFIKENDTVFLGPGTTIELIINYILVPNIQLVTSSYGVFQQIIQLDQRFPVILVGGNYHRESFSFNGPLSDNLVSKLHFDKAFIGAIGVVDGCLTNNSLDAGVLQSLVLSRSTERFLLADSEKFHEKGFYSFYELQSDDYLITDASLDDSLAKKYKKMVQLHLVT